MIPNRKTPPLLVTSQIHNFIEEVVTPVMKNVTVTFESDKVEDLTSNRVKTIFEGSEIIVAGKILEE